MLKIDFSKLIQKDYLLEPKLPASIEPILYLMIFFSVCIALATLVTISYRPHNYLYKNFKNRISKMFWACGLIGFVLLFFRWQTLSFLNLRIWLVALIAFFILWLAYNLLFYFVLLPKQLKVYQRQVEFQSFLPKNNAKN
ncbi:hypothetical protein CO101_00375 [Candidatus Berkelbacteria bacterium CG_4_9_14_3_um_filter_39_23]|uniref:DUF5671 domain-containing protein n=2 Tax=Candidatus Berkelbacteria TaxID=1618330 RepID=A0A2M7CJC7_9BACT|nr:hypothetical protein [Candidatus Berkelbacteria bacterium]OIP05586.1 MAG: hypothetical protein AUK14_01470 [Candidatus Berkelbacteria bacterium CG2_30_39_44]PIR28032.1 MAG: hypothetical protein COV39_01245 [Candidatus Berkelbacteria bacterium CG11_big_fil_rev_8_21_14_0_20_40_23]PIV25730.1 MAG: hypothetical protein COS38_00060 [Candidatus Berkelbacteria bacterium CG03_land_8_20_14_0_80_40_36]PIX30572.1 MAG: hypothetical protein COZ62_01905 [Candidatus Berkelbacteria bacterium CG_4_8_14_3_um_f